MNKTLKKYLGAALACLMLVGVPLHAVAQTAQGSATEAANPRGEGGVGFFNPSFLGMQVGIIENTIAPYQFVRADAGLLYGVCLHSATAGHRALALDYDSTEFNFSVEGTLTTHVAIPGTTAAQQANTDQIITPYVYSSGAVTGYRAPAVWGCWSPPWPVRFEDGLIGIQDAASGYSLYFYRTDDGTNPYKIK